MSDPWKHPLPARIIVKLIGPGLQVPQGGWHAAEFARQGPLLLKAMVRAARITQKKAFPFVAGKAKAIFVRQLDGVIARVLARAGRRSAKSDSVDISIVADEALWHQAITEVFAEAKLDVTTELVPPIQSVMAQAYSRTSLLLGLAKTTEANQEIASLARTVAGRITNISDTTRALFNREINQAMKDGMTVTETAAQLRDVMPDIIEWRVNMIARTELNNAWTKGSIESMRQSDQLTHVSVIGCESREEDRWQQPSYQRFMYHGESTCNIQDVPVIDADSLQFHPNHTGTVVPSKFRNEDGSSTELEE